MYVHVLVVQHELNGCKQYVLKACFVYCLVSICHLKRWISEAGYMVYSVAHTGA
jgi:hypothetical protein